MTTITTSGLNSDAGALGLQLKAQSLENIFEPLKKQWESSSFDQLFQSPDAELTRSSSEGHQSFSSERDIAKQESPLNLDYTSSAPQRPQIEQSLKSAQSVVAVSDGRGPGPNLVTVQEDDVLSMLRIMNPVSDKSGKLIGELNATTLETPSTTHLTNASDIQAQAVVVGIEGDGVRVWMRDGNSDLDREQLIAKIRAELSWAGMALGTLVLNGERLVGSR